MAGFQIPQVAPKFKTLVKAMTVGGFGAEDSRKVFEAMCKSLESSILMHQSPFPSLASVQKLVYGFEKN